MSASYLFNTASVLARHLKNTNLVKQSTLNRFQIISSQNQAKKYTSLTTVVRNSNDNGEESRQLNEGEKQLASLLRARFPLAKTIDVQDISGGCGSMYQIIVESVEFKNLRKVKQHQMVNDTLQKQIRNEMHGLRIHTAVPDE
jgi:stress-induced morphogen